MKKMILLFMGIVVSITNTLSAQNGIDVPEMTHCDESITSFLDNYNIPGATIAIAKDGKLIYNRAFGNAAQGEETQPYHRFRIASLSKPITALAIMKMYENGQLDLDETVFGTNGILANHPQLSTVNYNDDRYYDITVRMLLQHTAGWDRNQNCFPNPTTPYSFWRRGCDPFSAPLHVTETLGTSNPVTEEDLIQFTIEKGLNFTPGNNYAYSNMGYLVLGEVIETISGMSYEAYVQSAVFAPLGICDTQLGYNLLEDKLIREVQYYSSYSTISCYGTGEIVPWQYGGWNLEAMDAHGGWVSTAHDLVKLISAIDGNPVVQDILSQETLEEMSTPSSVNYNYACGWSVNSYGNWWHTGSLDGTATVMVKENNGYAWAFLLNKRSESSSPIEQSFFWTILDAEPWDCVNDITQIPTHDLFAKPEVSAGELEINLNASSANLNWQNGDGDYRIVVATTEDTVNGFPVDGIDYTANSVYGEGDMIGNAYVVYNGTGNSVEMTGLTENTDYQFAIFEYNKNNITGNHSLYNLCTEVNGSMAVSETISSNDVFDIYPNPAIDFVEIQTKNPGEYTYQIMDATGKIISQDTFVANHTINLRGQSLGIYFIRISQNGKVVKHAKIIKK